MGALGGRMDALRGGLAGTEPLDVALARNMSLVEGATVAGLAAEVRALADLLDTCDAAGLLAGRIAP
jgi:hypothetical protein